MCKWCENNKVWLFDFIFFICFFLLGSLTLDDLLFSSLLFCQVDLNWYIFFELINYFFLAKWQIFFEKNHCSKGINWCKAWLSDKGDMCKGNFRWQVEGTHQPEFPQITLRFSAEVAPSQKQTAKNKSPIKEISTTESKYLSLHKIQYAYVILKLVDQNASRWGRWG